MRTPRRPAPSRASPARKGGAGDQTCTPIRVVTLHPGVDLKLKLGVKNNRIEYHPRYLHYHQLLWCFHKGEFMHQNLVAGLHTTAPEAAEVRQGPGALSSLPDSSTAWNRVPGSKAEQRLPWEAAAGNPRFTAPWETCPAPAPIGRRRRGPRSGPGKVGTLARLWGKSSPEFLGGPRQGAGCSNVLSQRSSFATLGRNVKRKLDSERKKITGILGK